MWEIGGSVQGQKVLRRTQTPGEGTCRRPAGWGTDHVGIGTCKLHGGTTKSHRAQAAAIIVDTGAREAVRRQGVTPVHDPIAQLSLLAGEVVALKDVLGTKVAELRSWSYRGEGQEEEVSVLVTLYERALAQCHRVLSDMARLDLDTRLVRLSEAQANLLQQVIEAVLTSPEVDLDQDRQTVARTVLGKELTRVASG